MLQDFGLIDIRKMRKSEILEIVEDALPRTVAIT